jgi:hypothetical protein
MVFWWSRVYFGGKGCILVEKGGVLMDKGGILVVKGVFWW